MFTIALSGANLVCERPDAYSLTFGVTTNSGEHNCVALIHIILNWGKVVWSGIVLIFCFLCFILHVKVHYNCCAKCLQYFHCNHRIYAKFSRSGKMSYIQTAERTRRYCYDR